MAFFTIVRAIWRYCFLIVIGYCGLDDIDYAILERNGQISIVTKLAKT